MTYQNDAQLLEEDEDPTLRLNGQRVASRRQSGHVKGGEQQHASQEDLFLDLARADSVIDDASEVMSRSERRRVSAELPKRLFHGASKYDQSYLARVIPNPLPP